MRRWLVFLLLVQTLMGSAPAWAAPALRSAMLAGDTVHLALHLDEVGHHHHADGSVAQDDSQASRLHLLCDHGMASLPTPEFGPPALGPRADDPPGTAPEGQRGPWPDRLLRPPRG